MKPLKKILLPKLRILSECLAANENFVAHFCAQRLKELHFLFFFLFLLAQNRSAPLSPGFLFTKPSELFSSEHFYLYPHVGGTTMSCLLM